MVSASRTVIQPDGVFHVVMRTFVPASYRRADGWLMPNGPNRKNPAPRSSRLPNTLAASKRGTHIQSIAPSGATRAPVWQLERNAYSAMGGNGDGAAALCGSACRDARFGVVAVLAALMPASPRPARLRARAVSCLSFGAPFGARRGTRISRPAGAAGPHRNVGRPSPAGIVQMG